MLPRVFVRCGGGGGDEGGALLRRPRDQDPGLLGERPEAPSPDRLPADPGEPDALLRALRPPRVHPLPRLPGRSDQGVLPQLQRVSLQRLRALERRARDRAPEPGHRRLDHQLRRHRPAREHLAASARRAEASGGRERLSGELQRWSHRPAVEPLHRGVAGDELRRLHARRPGSARLPHRGDRLERHRAAAPARRGVGRPHQRRLLRVPPRDLRLRPARGRARGRALPSPDRPGNAPRPPLRRLLGQHGHVQGQAALRGSAHAGTGALAGLEGLTHPMQALELGTLAGAMQVLLCIGAHCDDIEIGCGGTVLRLLERNPGLEVHWIVLCSDALRRREGLDGARRFLGEGSQKHVEILSHRDGYLPHQNGEVKEYFESLKRTVQPDLILTHFRGDLHQDHRLVSELTWNTFRDHLILEFEIPKYDGDLGAPNLFVPLSESHVTRKPQNVLGAFVSQRTRRWFTEDTFRALMRLRGVECNAAGYAEAFYARKLVLQPRTLAEV